MLISRNRFQGKTCQAPTEIRKRNLWNVPDVVNGWCYIRGEKKKRPNKCHGRSQTSDQITEQLMLGKNPFSAEDQG